VEVPLWDHTGTIPLAPDLRRQLPRELVHS